MKRLNEYKDSDFSEISEYDLLRTKYHSLGIRVHKNIYAGSIESLLKDIPKKDTYIVTIRCIENSNSKDKIKINMGIKSIKINNLFNIKSEDEEKEFMDSLIHLDKRDYNILLDLVTSNNSNWEIAGMIINSEFYFDEQLYYLYLKRTEEQSKKIIDTSEYKWLGKLSRKALRQKKLNKISIVEKVNTVIIDCTIKELNIEVTNEKELIISKSTVKNINIKTSEKVLNLMITRSNIETINVDTTKLEKNEFPINFITDWKLMDSNVKNINIKVKRGLWDGKEIDISSVLITDNIPKETKITIITE